MNNNTRPRRSEQGGARLKFLIVAAIIGSVGYAGYQLIPVFYRDYQIKDLMQNDVNNAANLGKPSSWIKDQLLKNSEEYGIPADAIITPQLQPDNRMEVRVQFTLPVEFPGFVYNHEFDYTAKSATFLTVK
ncbi:MAG: hypothetical protein ACRD9S_20785 [Pyrinomonadaceae bacterium]